MKQHKIRRKRPKYGLYFLSDWYLFDRLYLDGDKLVLDKVSCLDKVVANFGQDFSSILFTSNYCYPFEDSIFQVETCKLAQPVV